MKWPWKKTQPERDWTVPDTGATAARERAERDLVRARRETERVRHETTVVQAQTPRYEQLGKDLREIHEVRNHLAHAFYTAARGRRA